MALRTPKTAETENCLLQMIVKRTPQWAAFDEMTIGY